MEPKAVMYEKLGTTLVKNLEKRHFSAQYCATAQEAAEALMARIAPEATVAWGGSATVDQLGVKEALRQRGQPMLDRAAAKTPEEADDIMRRCLSADVFLLSANAISADGVLVNMDGRGNRVSALIYGPKSVILVAGMNKVASSVEAAVQRLRSVAAPMNAQRFPGNTPCRINGVCGNCLSPDSICANLVLTRLCKPAGRIHVILVGEDLGM